MKKIIFGAMAATALLSCSKEQVLETNQNGNEISFSIETDNQTKAYEVYSQSNLMNEFTVRATYNNGTINKWYYTDVVTRNGSNASLWIGKDTHYWSYDGTHDFYACVKGDMTVGDTPEPPQIVDFSPSTDVSKQVDLLYAVTGNMTREDETVHLRFRHALSQIEFRAKNTNEKLHVIIKGVTVGNTITMATFTFPSTEYVYGCVYTPGTWSYGENWSIGSYSVTVNGEKGINIPNTSKRVDLTISSNHYFRKSMLLIATATLGEDAVGPAWDGEIFGTEPLFPGQALDDCCSYLAVNCEIYNIEGTEFNPDTDVKLYSGDAIISARFKWECGKKYIYTFVFGDGSCGQTPDGDPVLVPVRYQTEVEDFETVPDTNGEYDPDMDRNLPPYDPDMDPDLPSIPPVE